MEITKEKFIETFQDECSRAVDTVRKNAFVTKEFILEIVSNSTISFCVSKSPIWSTEGDEIKEFKFLGQIIFDGYVIYKEYSLTEQEYLRLEDYYLKCEEENGKRQRILIISKGESVLETMM